VKRIALDLESVLDYRCPAPMEVAARHELKAEFEKASRTFSRTNRAVLKYRYGICARKTAYEYSVQETVDIMGVASRTRVIAAESVAFALLAFRAAHLEQDLLPIRTSTGF
jgi:hypothetical protein